MPSCPCCRKPLTDAQVKTIWASYCASQRKRRPRVVWPKHSETARTCLCQACYDRREQERTESAKPPTPEPQQLPQELTYAELEGFHPEDWEDLIAHEARIYRHRLNRRKGSAKAIAALSERKNAKKNRANNAKRRLRLKGRRKRAEIEGVWGRIKEEAKRRAEAVTSDE